MFQITHSVIYIWRLYINSAQFSSVQFSCSVVFDSLWPHGLQHTRPPCPSPTPRAYSNSCPLSQWCHPTISTSAISCSSCLQSFPAQHLFKWVSSSHQVANVLEFQLQHQSFQSTQGWSPLEWTGWISLLSPTPQFKGISSSVLSFLYSPTLISTHDYWKKP